MCRFTFSSLVDICEYKWLIFACLKPESRPHIFDMASVPMAPRPCTSSFRQDKFRALLVRPETWSSLQQLLIWGVILGTLPFLFPPAYASGPLLGGIFSGTPPTSASLNAYMPHEMNFSHCYSV